MKCSQQRTGAAVVELAICIPVVLIIFLAGLDLNSVLRTRRALVETTHETSRVLATNDVTLAECVQFANQLLTNKGLTGGTIAIDPPPNSAIGRGTPLSLTITVPARDNCTLVSNVFNNLTLTANSTVSRGIGDMPATGSISY